MLQASRQLEGYLSQERHNLNRMNLNDNVSNEFLAVKVDSYNGLVTTLNHLFTVLTGVGLPLFERYAMDEDEEPVIVQLPSYVADTIGIPVAAPTIIPATMTDAAQIAEVLANLDVPERSDDPPTDGEIEQETAESDKPVDGGDDAQEEQLPLWVLDGYPSYESWVEDKEAESDKLRKDSDSALGMDVGLSQFRANQILTEYRESAEQDIDTYVPEDDVPASVFPPEPTEQEDAAHEDEDDGDPERPTRDLRYLSHTADDTRIDTDPAQITRVETAVEREGVNGSRGPDIDVDSYSYQSSGGSLVDSLISDEISKLRKPSTDD